METAANALSNLANSSTTEDEWDIFETNQLIKTICGNNKWGYIYHKSENRSCLNSRGLHLNQKGTSLVAKNISNYIASC